MTLPAAALRHRWWQALTLALAVGYLTMGLLSPTPSIRWPFVAAAALVAAALVLDTRSRPAAWAALVIGALIPIATTWWSVAGPVTGLLILGCGAAALRTRPATRPS